MWYIVRAPVHIPPHKVERAMMYDLHPPYNLGPEHQMTSNFLPKSPDHQDLEL